MSYKNENPVTESIFGTFDLLSCLKVYVKELPSDAALRKHNSSKDKRNCYNPFTS